MFPILIFQGEVARYKRKGKEANLEIVKLRKDLEDMKNAEIKALQVKKELMLKANVASEAAESLQMANNISANLDSNSQDSGSSPNSAEAGKLSQNYSVSSKECPLPPSFTSSDRLHFCSDCFNLVQWVVYYEFFFQQR